LAAVFIPVLFMGGVLGRLFREFAVTICVAILISGVVSVTLTPMLCSRFLKPPHEQKRSWFYRVTERYFDMLLHAYDVTLKWSLKARPLIMAIFVAVLVATGWMFIDIPKGFIPDQDTDQLLVTTEAAQGTSFDQMAVYQGQIADVLHRDPNVESFVSGIGGTNAATMGGPNFGQMVVHLKPRTERKLTVNDVTAQLRPKFADFPGMRVFLQNPPTVRIGGLVTKSLYQFTIQTPDKNELAISAEKLEKALQSEPSLEDVTTNLLIASPQVNINIDRDKAAAVGVNASQIENTLYDAYGPRWVSTIYSPINEYKVLLELQPKYQQDPKALSMLYFKSDAGKLIPLDTLAGIHTDTGPQSITHYGMLPAVTLSFAVKPGYALGDAVSRVQEVATKILPENVSSQFQGAAKAFQGSLTNLWVLLVIAVLVVYIVLGILYESYIHPMTILSGLPSAGFGAMLTLYLFKMDLNIYAFVGLIMLVGIVQKNAIMQIDFALDAEREGMKPMEAIYQGCLSRFRPIMMTTMAALLGAVPIALGYGAGGEARQPLGLVVVGGLMFSQLVTLYLTPVFYTYMAALQDLWRKRKKKVVFTEVSAN
ncbi:MAG TPA: efflux RND transporter permease subunit, partial [Bryobacteraceae bacterium]|nr:efflux RND transporter permease subunit [Bryobacteraceae bacterium]